MPSEEFNEDLQKEIQFLNPAKYAGGKNKWNKHIFGFSYFSGSKIYHILPVQIIKTRRYGTILEKKTHWLIIS